MTQIARLPFKVSSVGLLSLLLLSGTNLFADGELTREQIRQQIRRLDSGNFDDRQQAADLLSQAGLPAIEELQQAGTTAQGNLAAQCVRVLGEMSDSERKAIAKAATEALKKLAACDNQNIAAIAKEAIRDPDPPLQAANNPGARIQIMVGGNVMAKQFNAQGKREVSVMENGKKIKITEQRGGPVVVEIRETVNGQEKVTKVEGKNIADLARRNRAAFDLYKRHMLGLGLPNRIVMLQNAVGGRRQVTIRKQVINGDATTTINENGREIVIEEKQNGKIRVSVTETVNGQKQTKEYQADSLEELKKKHPEAAKLREKYANGAVGQVQFNIQAFPGAGPNVLPLQPGNALLPKAKGQQHPAYKEIEESLKDLKNVRKQMEQLKGQPNADKKQLEELEQALRKVEKGLYAAQKLLDRP